jgi:hypothetical protein
MTKLLCAALGLVGAAAWCWTADAQPAFAPPAIDSSSLVTHFQDQPTGPTVLTVVDPQTHVLAVYHISRDNGEIKLKAVRNFELDLRLIDFNGGSPKPEEIRKMFELQR